MNEAPPKPRRVLRFSLRGLLLLVLVVAVALGWAIHEARKQGMQRMSVVALEEMGCGVFCANSDDRHILIQRLSELLGEADSPAVLRVNAVATEINDAGMIHLQRLTDLISLDLTGTPVTDAGLLHLSGLTKLYALGLDETQVTSVGLVHLQAMTKLQGLGLKKTRVADAGLIYLRRLKELDTLDLSGTPLTDAGLVHLQGLTQLRFLSLNGSQVTDAGVQGLKKVLPNCTISY
jgi:Leucine Rich repeat